MTCHLLLYSYYNKTANREKDCVSRNKCNLDFMRESHKGDKIIPV